MGTAILFLLPLSSSALRLTSLCPPLPHTAVPFPCLSQLSCRNDPQADEVLTCLRGPTLPVCMKQPITCKTFIFFPRSSLRDIGLAILPTHLVTCFSCSCITAFHSLSPSTFLIYHCAWWILAYLKKHLLLSWESLGQLSCFSLWIILHKFSMCVTKFPCGFCSSGDRP